MRLKLTALATALSAALPALAQTQPSAAPPGSNDGATTTLPRVVVSADRESYTPRSTAAGTRSDTPLEHIPQSVVVVPKAMIEDQQAKTVSDVLRNVSNVNYVDQRDGNNVGFKIRGFTSSTVVDGVAMPGYFSNQESLINVERIDVVKGPAGALFGATQGMGSYGNLGGTIAITTSEPTATPLRQVGMTAGSFSSYGINADFNQPFSPTLAMRVSGEFSRSHSETDRVFFDRTAVFPSIAWTPNADTKVVLRARYVENKTLDYSGLPLLGTLLTDATTLRLARSLMIAANDQPDTSNRSQGATLQWTQRLGRDWSFSLIAAQQQAFVDQRGTWLVDATSAYGCFAFGVVSPSANLLCGARLWDKFNTTTVSPSLTGKLDLGATKHTLSVGLDHEKTRDDAFINYSNLFGPVSTTVVSLTNPTFPAWAEPLAPVTPDQQNRYRATVAYVQDQIDFGPLHVLGSLRYSKIDVTDVNAAFLISNVSSNSKVTPRAGFTFDLTPGVSLFAGYSEGIKVPTGSIFSKPPKPEEAQQLEGGIRFAGFNGLSGTVAYFDLRRKNVAIADALKPGYSTQGGLQRAKGVDADLRWKVTPALTLIGAFTSQTARFEADSNALLVGKRLFNAPETTARVAMRYDVAAGGMTGLGLGAGLTYHGNLAGDNYNSFFTPAATVWDAQVSYKFGKARIGLGINNLLDKKYYVPSAYFGGGQVTPALPRTLSATLQYAFN